jgi:hypothetical protein
LHPIRPEVQFFFGLQCPNIFDASETPERNPYKAIFRHPPALRRCPAVARVAFSGVAAFISRSDASWPPAGIRKPAVADLMRPAQFGHHQPRGKKVSLMDKVAVAASKSDATVVLFDIGVTAEAKI